MYKVTSIKTGKQSVLTAEQWQKMVQRGDSVKFTASPIKATETKVPTEVAAKTKKDKQAVVVEGPAETTNEQNGEAPAMPADNSEDDIN